MKTFGGDSEQEKAMSKLLHDTANDLQDMNWRITKLAEWLAENSKVLRTHDEKVSSAPYVHIEYMKTRSNSIRKALDEYTIKFQNDWNTNP